MAGDGKTAATGASGKKPVRKIQQVLVPGKRFLYLYKLIIDAIFLRS